MFGVPEVIGDNFDDGDRPQKNQAVTAEHGLLEGLLIDQHLEYQAIQEPAHDTAEDALQQGFFSASLFLICP